MVKLKQGHIEDLVIIGIDCLGAFSNRDYINWIEKNAEDATEKFYTRVLAGKDYRCRRC